MITKRRKFSPEFKYESACLVLDKGYSYKEASQLLEVRDSVLRRWVQQVEKERGGGTPDSPALTPEQQRIQELEKQVKRLELEKDILKKATALLMSDEIPRTR